MAIQAALTGHLVFSTLHTNDSASAYTRLLDMGLNPTDHIDRYRDSGSAAGGKICTRCREYTPEPSCFPKSEYVRYSALQREGCKQCGGSGYSGRIGIFELGT